MKNKKIVTIGGGSAQFVLLSAIRDLPFDITSVVSMTDSGGSTGRLRDELGVLPPGDILKCLIALSPYREMAREIFHYRFEEESLLKGHNAGNLLLTGLGQRAGNFPAGVEAFAQILKIKGRVLPVTLERATLVAEFDNGERVFGEAAIDRPNRGKTVGRITNVFLSPHHSDKVLVYPPVIEAIMEADYVLIGPGDLFTSIMPNLKVAGVAEAVKMTNAAIIYLANIMTKHGETDDFTLYDFLAVIEKAINRKVDSVLLNNRQPDEATLARYADERAVFIEPLIKAGESRMMVAEDLLDESSPVMRHDPEKLAKIITELL